MNDQTRQFLRQRFREYYSERRVLPPPGIINREWGFIFYDDTPGVAMRRHKAFNSEGELKDYLASMPPAHAYHSAAYYQYPQAPTMLEKKWQGADLIFDLDADHLPGVKDMSYSEMLTNVKKEIIRLIDEFLIDDLGFRTNDMDIVFSGGRGYHVHVRDTRVIPLKSPERREIVDYLLGTGLEAEKMFTRIKEIKDNTQLTKFRGVESRVIGSNANVWRIRGYETEKGRGWNLRVAQFIVNKLKEINVIAVKSNKEAIEYVKNFNLDTKQAKTIINAAKNPKSNDLILEYGYLDFSGDLGPFFQIMLKGAIDEFKIDLAGKTDEPVTADIKRLIRLPGSIHGGSSFRVVPLTRSQLENFNPLEDAIIFGDSPVRVLVTRPMEAEVKGKVYRVSEGVGRLPENVAMFLMCRGSAEYEP